MKFIQIFFLLLTFSVFSQTTFEKAEKLYAQKKYNEAEKLFSEHLKSQPNHAKTIEYLGDIAGHQKDWDAAITNYKKLKVSYPKVANYWYKYNRFSLLFLSTPAHVQNLFFAVMQDRIYR